MYIEFADDSKSGVAVDLLEGREDLQGDMGRLEIWTIINHTKCKKSKCWILHLRQRNHGYTYKLGDERLESNPAESDMEVWFDGKLNMSQQCALVTKTTNCASSTA